MKPIRYIAYTVLCSLMLLATGCQKEELTKQSNGKEFTIQITGEGSTSVLTRAEVNEDVTIPLHLLIYKVGAADGDAPVFYKKDELVAAQAKAIKCSFPAGLSVSDRYDIYVVGSSDVDAAGISDATTKSALLAFTQTGIDGITSKTKPYMLAGVTSNTPLDSSPTVQIVRNVCRLDFTLTDESNSAIDNIEVTLAAPDKTFLFSSALRGTGLENTFPADTKHDYEQKFKLTATGTAGEFAGSVFFFEKMTTEVGVLTEADRVKLIINVTKTAGKPERYVAFINANDKYITKRNTIYEVNGTLKDKSIVITTTNIPWNEVVENDEIPTPIIMQPKANTYLIAPGSSSILIPVAQANDAIALSIGAGDVLTAEMIWTDVKGAKTGKGLAADAAVAAIQVLGAGPEAALMVTPGSEPGNAVIAVRSAAGIVKWSWHIWVTDYDPSKENGQNTSGGYIFMDRNLGAKSIVPSTTGQDIIGNYYQYGRKDPFPTKSSVLGYITVYKADGSVATRGTYTALSYANQIMNPYSYGSLTGMPADLDLWVKNGNKTVNDPCPSGWRIPSADAYIDLTHTLFPLDASSWGRQGAHTGYFPVTWTINGNADNIWNVELVANWTSTQTGTTTARMLRCDRSGSVDGNYSYYRNFGNTVRCVRDIKGKAEKEIRVLSAGANVVSLAHQLGTNVPAKTWQEGLVPLLTQNFGQGKPVDVFFKFYNYYTGSMATTYGFIDLLSTYDIDVLHLAYYDYNAAYPSVEESKKILEWLDADPHRVLFITPDEDRILANLRLALGFTKMNGEDGTNAKLSNIVDSEIYNTLVTAGKYGSIATNAKFDFTYNWGSFDRSEVLANGYVPILEKIGYPNQIVMAINPTRRVVIFSDSAPFWGTYVLNLDGSLKTTTKGEYPVLMANVWSWIASVVKAK